LHLEQAKEPGRHHDIKDEREVVRERRRSGSSGTAKTDDARIRDITRRDGERAERSERAPQEKPAEERSKHQGAARAAHNGHGKQTESVASWNWGMERTQGIRPGTREQDPQAGHGKGEEGAERRIRARSDLHGRTESRASKEEERLGATYGGAEVRANTVGHREERRWACGAREQGTAQKSTMGERRGFNELELEERAA
jgi:hypothetical protein